MFGERAKCSFCLGWVPSVWDYLGVGLGGQTNLILALWVYGYLIHRWQYVSNL